MSRMRVLVLMTVFICSLTCSAAEVLDLDSYFMSVKMRGTSILYIHDVYDSNRVPRFTLLKTVLPVFRDGRRGEDYTYAFGIKDAAGNVTWATLDESLYKNLRAKIERAKLETAARAWLRGCQIRAVIGDQSELVSFISLCEGIPADEPTGTIEADANR
jgi:hypothetical protein